MLQGCRGLDLRQEPLGAEDSGQLGLEYLDRDFAVVFQVLGEIDHGHPALSQLTLDAVAVREGCSEAGLGIVHGGALESTSLPVGARVRRPRLTIALSSWNVAQVKETMTPEAIRLVRESWARLEETRVDLAHAFYRHLFESHRTCVACLATCRPGPRRRNSPTCWARSSPSSTGPIACSRRFSCWAIGTAVRCDSLRLRAGRRCPAAGAGGTTGHRVHAPIACGVARSLSDGGSDNGAARDTGGHETPLDP